jgi:hypothetical protein
VNQTQPNNAVNPPKKSPHNQNKKSFKPKNRPTSASSSLSPSVTSQTQTQNDSDPQQNSIKLQLRERIRQNKKKDPKEVIECYFAAEKASLELERADYLLVFVAFMTPFPYNPYYLNPSVFTVYERIKRDALWTKETIRTAVKLFEYQGMLNELMELCDIIDKILPPHHEVHIA